MSIELDIKVGDVVLGGKFKNKRIVVKTIGKDDLGQPTINGMPLLKMRIEKLLPIEKQSKETRENDESMKNESIKITKKQLREMIKEAYDKAMCESEEDETVTEQAFSHMNNAVTPEQLQEVLSVVDRILYWPRLHKAVADKSPNVKNLLVLAASALEEQAKNLRKLANKS